MKQAILALCALGTVAYALAPSAPTPSSGAAPAAAPFHCQVPCGIYGDRMRVDMLMEDAATIEKGMQTLTGLDVSADRNQVVRWIMNKDDHAQNVQDVVAQYWLAQRVKKPADASDAAAMNKYHRQLEHMHGITVDAMQCKQTTDPAHVESMRKHALDFSALYFSPEDLEHVRSHHAGGDEK